MLDPAARPILEEALAALEAAHPKNKHVDGEWRPHPAIAGLRKLLGEPSPMCPAPRPYADLLEVAGALADEVGALDRPGAKWEVVPGRVLNMADDIFRARLGKPMTYDWKGGDNVE